jgi:hypothetical protein
VNTGFGCDAGLSPPLMYRKHSGKKIILAPAAAAVSIDLKQLATLADTSLLLHI